MTDHPYRRKPPPLPPDTVPSVPAAPPASDPAMRAAGLVGRPSMASSPSLANPEALRHEVIRHGALLGNHENRIGGLEGVRDGQALYADGVAEQLDDQDKVLILLARANGLENDLPERYRRSIPPPGAGKRSPTAIVPKIERDSWQTKIAAYAIAIATVAKIFWDVFHGGTQ